MCGRIVQKSGILKLSIVEGMEERDSRAPKSNFPPRYNGAPGQEHLVIRRNPESGDITIEPIKWGLIPSWCKDEKGGRRPINARAETVKTAPMFKAAYAKRRCIVPVDLFFEWRAIKGAKAKQPYAVGLKSGQPFGLAALWENWKNPKGEWVRTFTIITTDANEMMAKIHDRMPVILAPEDHARWLSDAGEADDLLRPFPAELMTMWPVSARVNSFRYDAADILDEVKEQLIKLP